jgi:hypothetical protein
MVKKKQVSKKKGKQQLAVAEESAQTRRLEEL